MYPALKDLDFHDEVLLVLSERDIVYLTQMTWSGLLVVARDPCGRRIGWHAHLEEIARAVGQPEFDEVNTARSVRLHQRGR